MFNLLASFTQLQKVQLGNSFRKYKIRKNHKSARYQFQIIFIIWLRREVNLVK